MRLSLRNERLGLYLGGFGSKALRQFGSDQVGDRVIGSGALDAPPPRPKSKWKPGDGMVATGGFRTGELRTGWPGVAAEGSTRPALPSCAERCAIRSTRFATAPAEVGDLSMPGMRTAGATIFAAGAPGIRTGGTDSMTVSGPGGEEGGGFSINRASSAMRSSVLSVGPGICCDLAGGMNSAHDVFEDPTQPPLG
jgi:hypothetical protein